MEKAENIPPYKVVVADMFWSPPSPEVVKTKNSSELFVTKNDAGNRFYESSETESKQRGIGEIGIVCMAVCISVHV